MLPPIHKRNFTPRWCDFSWQPKPLPAIKVRIYQGYLEVAEPFTENSPIVKDAQSYFGLGQFFSRFTESDGCFGFGSNLAPVIYHRDFFDIYFPFPDCQMESGVSCESCGLGRRWGARACEECGGRGRQVITNEDLAYQTAVPISILLSWLRSPRRDTRSREPQLFSLTTSLMKNQCGGTSIHGEMSGLVREYLRMLGEGNQIPEVLAATKEAYFRMSGKRSYQDNCFQAMVLEGGRFTIEVPGNAVGVTAAPSSNSKPGEGCRLDSHNMDDAPIAQLAILAGLGALHDEARRWLHKKMRGA